MNSPLKFGNIQIIVVTFLLVALLILIPGLSFASYHSIGDLAPAPTPPPPPEAPGDLAPIPEPEEPEAPVDPTPAPETTEEDDPEAVDETVEEVPEEEELIIEANDPETEAEEVITRVSQVNIWFIFLGLLLVIALLCFLVKCRREVSNNE